MRTDDETWLGQLREVRLGEERAETDLEEGSQRKHLRRVEHGGDHRRWPRHSVHHGPSRRIQARPGLDSREPRLRYREYLILLPHSLPIEYKLFYKRTSWEVSISKLWIQNFWILIETTFINIYFKMSIYEYIYF